jgi:quercetin dioxygenase-like cupin family protein
MSLHHAAPGEPIDVRPLGPKLAESNSTALLRTDDLEVMRLVLTRGRSVPEHEVAGGIILHCLEGAVEVKTRGTMQVLRAGNMLYLEGHVPYSLRAVEDSSILMTVLRKETMH